MKGIGFFITCLLASSVSFGQLTAVRNFNLELVEKDSAKSYVLEQALNGFLNEALASNYTEKYTDTTHVNQYNFFFKKLAGIGHSNETFRFNPPSILKSYSADGKAYRLTVAFTGVREDIPFVYQITELKAVPYLDSYRFYCPFEDNTKHFKQKQVKTVTYHYSSAIDEAKAYAFADFKDELCDLTATPKKELDYYCFEDLDELLKSYGFLYSARQCNFLCYDLGFSDHEGKMFLTGTNNENYLSEYVENFLYYNLPNSDNMYWTFAVGISTYYGGYGLHYTSLPELKQEFRDELKANPDFDFLSEFKKGRKSSVNRHFSHYVMSAFLCEAVLEKKGFDDLLVLLYSGENGETFFENLKKVLDVDESNFNETILALVNQAV